jgi:hypothetical protein
VAIISNRTQINLRRSLWPRKVYNEIYIVNDLCHYDNFWGKKKTHFDPQKHV